MKKKNPYILFIFLTILVIIGAIYFLTKDTFENPEITAKRLSTETDESKENVSKEKNDKKNAPTETELSSFSTPLLDTASRKGQ